LNFEPTRIPGAFVVHPERHADERGFFARTWCADELAAQGLVARLAQASVSWNRRRGTLREMRQAAPRRGELSRARRDLGRIADLRLLAGIPTMARRDSTRSLDALRRPASRSDADDTLPPPDLRRISPITRAAWDDPTSTLPEPPVVTERDQHCHCSGAIR
jgi:dTDP-4-dehydrorhamnose 3,5-epimerase